MRDKQREETRRKLYQAALEVFCRDGVSQCRIEDIAQIAQVSRAAFYFHFPSKDDVLFELLQESELPLVDALEKLPPEAPLNELFETVIVHLDGFWSVGDRRKLLADVFGVVLRRSQTLIADREAEVVRAALGRLVTAAARNELSPDIPAEVLADFYLLNCFAAMVSWCAQPIMPLADMLRGVTHLFLHGAAPK